MNSRRDFLKKSSMAGALFLTVPQLIIPKGSREKLHFYKKFKPAKESYHIAAIEEINNIAFSRSSIATYFDPNGLIKYADQNLLTYSQDFQDTSWSKVGSSVTTSTDIAAPDGTFTSQILTEINMTGEHRLSRTVTVKQGIMQTFSIYLKAGTCVKVRLSFLNSASYTGGNPPKLNVDLTTGVISLKSANIVNATSINSGNGWWRISMTGLPDLGTSSGLTVYMLNSSDSTSYPATATKNLYMWGAQFEAGPGMSIYRPTTNQLYYGPRYNYDTATLNLNGLMVEPASTNLLKQSEKLNDATIWLARNTIIQANSILSPDGIVKAIKLSEDSLSISHYIRPATKPSTIIGQIYTFSAFIKAGERTWAYFMIEDATVHFDLINGLVGGNTINPAFIYTNVQKIGNGWFRCSASFTATLVSTSTGIGLEISNGAKQYAGNGVSGIYVWGPQLETGIAASSYIPTGPGSATRNNETCQLLSPDPTSLYDVFIQRTNGGTWIDNVSNSYTIPYSRYEVQTGSFWELGATAGEKEEIAQELFPPAYINAGSSTTKLSILGNDYRIQSPNKSWSLNWAKNKTCQLYRFQLNSGDQWSSDAGKDKERSELYSLTKYPFDQDVWLSYAIKVAPGNPVTSQFCHLGQWHATEDSGDTASVPILTFRFTGADIITLTTCSTTVNPHTINPPSVIRYAGRLPRGQWVRNVMRIRFSPTNGQLQWWENGIQKLDLSGIGIGNPDSIGPYWKYGIYRTRSVETLVVEYANMEVSLTSLLSRVTNPLLIV